MVVQSKAVKEKQKLINDKCQALIEVLLKDEDNKYCVDCDAKSPRWASWNLGIFLCIRCAGIHRNLGVHISRVKSVNLDSWGPEHVAYIQRMGNSRARAVYEANLPDGFRRPQTDSTLETFIRAKYEYKKYIAQGWTDPGPPAPAFDVEEELRKAKEQKRQKSRSVTSSATLTTQPASVAATSSLPRPSESSGSEHLSKSTPGQMGIKAVAANVAASNRASQNDTKRSNVLDLLAIDNDTNSSSTSFDSAGATKVSKQSASDDLFGIFGGSEPKSSTETSGMFSSTAASALSSNASLLASTLAEKKPLTKESILSLYSSNSSSAAIPDPFGMTSSISSNSFGNSHGSTIIPNSNQLPSVGNNVSGHFMPSQLAQPANQQSTGFTFMSGASNLSNQFSTGNTALPADPMSSLGTLYQTGNSGAQLMAGSSTNPPPKSTSNSKSIDDIFSGLDILGKQKQQQMSRANLMSDNGVTPPQSNPLPGQSISNPFLS